MGFIGWAGLVRKGFFESRDRFCWEQGLETRCKAPVCRPTRTCTGIQGFAGGAFADAGMRGSCRLGKKTGQGQLWLGLQQEMKMQRAEQKGQSVGNKGLFLTNQASRCLIQSILHLFIECLLCARHCSGIWGCRDEKSKDLASRSLHSADGGAGEENNDKL